MSSSNEPSIDVKTASEQYIETGMERLIKTSDNKSVNLELSTNMNSEKSVRFNSFNRILRILIFFMLISGFVFLDDFTKLKLKLQIKSVPLDSLYSTQIIPEGTFSMGCHEQCTDDEKNVHTVHIEPSLLMMRSEVTQSLYEKVIGSNPSQFVGANLPVDNVTWFQAISFANALSELEGLEKCYQDKGVEIEWPNTACLGWRLPTEAEWEYAAKGGADYKYAGSSDYNTVAWNKSNSNKRPHDVCTKLVNGYKLCDMNGNVLEWVWDRYGEDYYEKSPVNNPKGPSNGLNRIFRGGGWGVNELAGRVWTRMNISPIVTDKSLGFRLVRYTSNPQ